MTYIRILVLILISIFLLGNSLAELPSDFDYPRTVSTIRQIIPTDGHLIGCSKNGDVEECWQCVSQGCNYRVNREFDEWDVNCLLSVFSERHVKSCSITGYGIGVGQKMISDTSQFSFYSVQDPGKDLHEYRPVYVIIDNQRFINPEDGPYRKLELQTKDGALLEQDYLLDLISNANMITTESWDVDDQKSSKTDRGKGFSDAREFVSEFQAWTQ